MKISVVVPTYRRPETLRTTISALLMTELPAGEYEVVVVDDGRSLETTAILATFHDAPLTCIVSPGTGAAAARNAGARIAAGSVVLFLDDDMRVRPTHLRQHLETHAAYNDAIVGGDRWYSPESLRALQSSPFGRYRIALERLYAAGRGEGDGRGVASVSTLPSFDMSIDRNRFWDLGGFDESFPYAGAEDQDLSARALGAGLSLLRNHEIKLLHDDPTTTLRQFAEREERGAHTVVALVRKYPESLGEFRKNNPIEPGDPPVLVASKLAKSALSARTVLQGLHTIADWLERCGASDRVLRPVYRVIIGLHIFRGYRTARREALQAGR